MCKKLVHPRIKKQKKCVILEIYIKILKGKKRGDKLGKMKRITFII